MNYLNITHKGIGTTNISLAAQPGEATPKNRVKVFYSFDKENWTDWDYSAISISNNTVYFYGDNPNGWNTDGVSDTNWTFRITAAGANDDIIVAGDVTTLLRKSGGVNELPSIYCFQALFISDPVTNADGLVLPSMKLTDYCYNGLFYSCQRLKSAKFKLPATELTVGCYSNMLQNCYVLTAAQDYLPATILKDNCYNSMYSKTTALNVAPSFHCKKTAYRCCYQMFNGTKTIWSGIVDASNIIIEDDVAAEEAMRSMFLYDLSLIKSPIIAVNKLSTRSCYQMFAGAEHLDTITIYAKNISASEALSNWSNYVASKGTFYQRNGVTYPSGISGIPSGWTKVYILEDFDTNWDSVYSVTKDILKNSSYPVKDSYDSTYSVLVDLLDAVEKAEIQSADTNYILNIYPNGDNPYYTFSGNVTSGDFLEGSIKINGIIPGGTYKAFATGNEVGVILIGSNYSGQAVSLVKSGDKYINK